MDILIKGITFGLILALAMGPVFFSLIQTSIEKGFTSGLFMAIGISISDLTYVFLSYMGISKFASNESFKFYVGVIGGSILIIFGITSFLKKKAGGSIVKAPQNNGGGFFRPFIKGMIINGINPFVFLFWIGAMSFATVDYGYSAFELRMFFLVVLLTVFTTDIVKSYAAVRLSRLVKPHIMNTMNSIVGLLLVIFGIRLVYLALV